MKHSLLALNAKICHKRTIQTARSDDKIATPLAILLEQDATLQRLNSHQEIKSRAGTQHRTVADPKTLGAAANRPLAYNYNGEDGLNGAANDESRLLPSAPPPGGGGPD